MKNFFKALLPVERLALGAAVVAAIILTVMGFIYPTAGVATLFMLGTLTAFWSMMTLIAAVNRYFTTQKRIQRREADDNL